MVVGILALVFYNDLIVKRYFEEINGTPAPVPAQQTPSQPEADPAAPLRTRKVA